MKNLTAALIIILLIAGCAAQEIEKSNAIAEGNIEIDKETPAKKDITKETPKKDIIDEVPAKEVEKPLIQKAPEEKIPRKNLSVYLGLWMPAPDAPSMQSMEKREDLVNIGSNAVAFGIGIKYEKDGSVLPQNADYVKEKTRELIRYYKEAGLAVIFSPEPVPSDIFGEPGPVPSEVMENFLSDYSDLIVELAEIAEEENVEIFSPMNELDYKLGVETSSTWGQDILPKIRRAFKGKVLWKGSLSEFFQGQKSIDFSGYDIVGFTIFPHGGINNYKEAVASSIEVLNKWAKEDGVPEVFVSEFGTYKPVQIAKEDEPKSIQHVFDAAKGKHVTGFFIFDPPSGFGTPIKGSKLEQTTREEFAKIKKPTAIPDLSGQENSDPSWKAGGVAIAGNYADADVVDLGNGKYRMYYSLEPEVSGFKGQVYSTISSDGKKWVQEDGTRMEWATFPSVIKLPDGRFRMYYQNAGVIKSAISSDGISWSEELGTRIDADNSAGLSLTVVGAPTVMKMGDKYLIVYFGAINQKYTDAGMVPNSETHLFLWATSSDGLTFEKKGIALDSRNNEFKGWIDGPEFVEWENELRLYFWSYKGIYHVTYKDGKFSESEDAVFEFTTDSDPKKPFPENPPGDPTLAKINGKWFMYYGQHEKGIYYATLEG